MTVASVDRPTEADEELLTAREVALFLKCSVRSVQRMPIEQLPRVELGPQLVRYRLSDVERMIGKCTRRVIRFRRREG